MIEIKLSTLPVPKTNRYIRTRRGKVFKPPRVTIWESKALWEIMNQYKGEPLEGKLSVEIFIKLPNKRRRDIDNMLKSLWDVLEKGKVIKNDSQIFEVRTVKEIVKGQEEVVIRIKEFKVP